MEILFWTSLALVFYTYIGYGIVLFALVKIKRLFVGKHVPPGTADLPSLTVVVAAYNEQDFIAQKIANTLSLNYPQAKAKFLFVTDGSTDDTPKLVENFPLVRLMHSPKRSGKIAAIHRAMETVDTEIVVFTDANTFLNKDALINIARHYADPKTGAVSGEKRVNIDADSDATAGEGMYWKYESKLKEWDSELYSVIGAAGELFSVRRSLYQPVKPETILDDFMISMLIAKKGYKIVYEPLSYACENSSENVKEELKRKVRIAAGGLQSIIWLKSLLLPFKHPLLSFQYVSHRVLRWTVTPFAMILTFVLNVVIVAFSASFDLLLSLLLLCQLAFYGMAMLGWYFENKSIKVKVLFVPYYFCMMNYAVILGIATYLQGKQSSTWEKANRKL